MTNLDKNSFWPVGFVAQSDPNRSEKATACVTSAKRRAEFERVMGWLHEHGYVIEYRDREDGCYDRAFYGGHTMDAMADDYGAG